MSTVRFNGTSTRRLYRYPRLLLPLLLALPVQLALAGERFDWNISPYIWAAETDYQLKAFGTPVDAGTVTFDDLLDTTDASFQVVAEVAPKDGHWSMFADITWLDMSDNTVANLLRTDTDSEQWIVDAAVTWWPAGQGSGFGLVAGLRYTDLADTYDFSLADSGTPVFSLKNNRDFLDALAGVRYRRVLSDRWSLLGRGDYSTGDSDGIWQLQAIIRYGLGKERQHGVMFGYRYKEAKFKYRNLEEDNQYYGPLVGFQFRF